MTKDTKSIVYIRILPETRRRARVRAAEDGVTLGAVVEAALLQYLDKSSEGGTKDTVTA